VEVARAARAWLLDVGRPGAAAAARAAPAAASRAASRAGAAARRGVHAALEALDAAGRAQST
jgi:hypothetical protein